MARDLLDNDEPLLTRNQIRDWQARKAELEREIGVRLSELEVIDHKLKAAAAFFDNSVLPGNGSAQVHGSEEPTLASVLLQVMREAGRPLKPRAIREAALKKQPNWSDRLATTSNYSYMVLAKLVKRGEIVKVGDKYELAKH